mmetsp:Transcript_4938/g.9551  ORF Transcript_4938/g.9551 Transcript_4938/m.9551 type:complete len:229 (+) Transcript_4938:56-742(+)|eukprot:CAMPEP_0175160274 /NCGR_PEP_ID=MMETSP0087-20121206/23920_1 /TAXON_ID=136419 /ORGANISM="Unknown Unknown, Strain D1" /LENGTH=228 /DNA_ID=CAMNT_0016448483 /DNA_START=55 /DNA_END=741 /DNA_ORIENTATION=-
MAFHPTDKAVFLKDHTNNIQKLLKTFEPGVRAEVKKEQQISDKTLKLVQILEQMAQHETCPAAQKSLDKLASALNNTQNNREALIDQLETNIIGQFGTFPEKLKKLQASTRNRDKVMKAALQSHKKVIGLQEKKKVKPAVLAVATQKDNQDQAKMREVENNFNSETVNFEKERLNGLKDMLLAYVQGHMFLHARSLEGLSEVFAAIHAIDVEKEGKDLKRKLRDMESE